VSTHTPRVANRTAGFHLALAWPRCPPPWAVPLCLAPDGSKMWVIYNSKTRGGNTIQDCMCVAESSSFLIRLTHKACSHKWRNNYGLLIFLCCTALMQMCLPDSHNAKPSWCGKRETHTYRHRQWRHAHFSVVE
jgi:hypothetical protein